MKPWPETALSRARQWIGNRKKYRYFRCKNCKTSLRVPRGKGIIRVHCPRCDHELTAKT